MKSAETAERGKKLLAIARKELEESFDLHPSWPQDVEPWLEEVAATFVTLTKSGDLRGCVGTLRPRRTLIEDVRGNARSAAFEDPRFPPLTLDELQDVEIEVSVLSPVEPVAFEDEDDLLAKLRPGVDGLVIERGFHRGTFLPQVWEKLPEPKVFLYQLKKKAGLDPGYWPADLRVFRYTVEEWREGS
jgi:AmmeMemoRadiSam system protein A